MVGIIWKRRHYDRMGIVTGRFPYADSAKLMFLTQPPEGFRMLTQHFQIMTALHIPLFVRRSKMIMSGWFQRLTTLEEACTTWAIHALQTQ